MGRSRSSVAALFRWREASRLLCGMGAALVAFLLGIPSPAFAQSPPSFQEYPLRDRILGPGGAVFPNYVTPSESSIAYLTGAAGGPKGIAFGAATVDFLCQTEQRPTITILSAPPRGKVVVTPGAFVATATDAGSTFCLGRRVEGAVVRFVGRPPKGGVKIALRVTYPHLGAWYDHVVEVPSR
ncbi:hypothetical protein [Aquabacter spiritensis]|uniref:Uncharacterized protein n=1 Tax=Aquabacter spiritensis TaxID=933073 RepID=A0A4R3M2Y2_9HYPH|nr:hypothetical protein [Aquabacter spiritensis]TCT07571.1 hypothetical protein EDC64_10190 [Aquabacter spiritensis]